MRCWWHLAVPAGLLIAAAAAGVVFSMKVDTYTASAWVWIKEKPPSLLSGAPAEDPRKFVNNQIELLRSPPLLEPIAGDPAVASTPELAREIDPVQYLRNKLRIRALGQSDYFEIAFTSRSAEKAAIVVNKVAHEYVALQQKQQNKSSTRTIELLQVHQLAQQKEVTRLHDELEQLSKEIHGKDAFPNRSADRRPQSSPVADLQSQLDRAEVELAVLKAHIQAEQEQFLRESFEPSQAEVEVQVEAHPRVGAARDQLQLSQKNFADAKRVATDIKRLPATYEKQVQDHQAALDRALADVRALVKTAAEKSARARNQDQITELQAQARRLGVSVGFLQDRLKEHRGVQQDVAGDTLKYEFVQRDYDRARQFFDAISSRIISMQTEQHAPERVEIFRTAPVPTRVDEELPFKKMVMAAGGAFLLPFALAVLLEMLFRRVSERSQVEAVTELALVGEVTTLPRRLAAKSRTLTSAGRDLQLYEESIDGLRTLLMLFESTRGQKVLSVTSAVSGEGKTSLAAQLAVSIASATNRPTLLIDGDMRSPDVHRIFDVDRGPGLYEVLKGECSVQEAIETEFSDKLHLLTAGDLDMSPHRIMGGGKFHELIAKLRDLYEFIVIDTPPILPASEALLMSSAADSTILCVRRDFSRIDQLMEASKRLRSSGVNLAGAVLSGVPVHQYSYRYGSYYYVRPNGPNDAPAPTPVEMTDGKAS